VSRLLVVLLSCLLLADCGGGGGGSPPAAGAPSSPTVQIAASATTVANGSSSTLTWSSTNATSCTATGAWSGNRGPAGSESTAVLHASSNFNLECTGPGGIASATASVKVLGVFPLSVELNKQYLIDAEGNPFLLQGDAAWDLITQLTKQEAADYLENRRQKGFNAVIVRLIDHHFSPNPPKNDAGDSPFTTPLCTVVAQDCNFDNARNEAYFAHAAWVIDKAAEKGILVLLAPVYTGFDGLNEGWFQEMQDPTTGGTVRLNAYGLYVGDRYKNFTNILWVDGGDFSPPTAAGMDLVRKVAQGIVANYPGALHTFHGKRFTEALDYWGTSETWLTVNDIYTDENTVFSMAAVAYNRPSKMPFFMIENRYENEQGPLMTSPADAALVRTQAYQAMLSGATGYVMGNFPVWDFATGWPAALNIGAATTLQHLRHLFEARAWHTLQPDLSNNLLIGGIGVDKDRAVAALATGGSFAVAYVPGPSSRTINIKLSLLSGPNIKAQWCDPTNGNCTPDANSPFGLVANQSFTTPASPNSGGFNDWVLLLESVP
jgi:uncharacterized protein DUF4038/collagenase-like protein with putative collagen-binding domain